MLAAALLAFNFVSFLKGLMLFFFILSAILLMVVVLLQEPKGGGLSSAFGGAGAETFGVQAGGVNKFTAVVAGVYLVLAVLYAAIRPPDAVAPSEVVTPPPTEAGQLEEPSEPPPSGEEKKPGG